MTAVNILFFAYAYQVQLFPTYNSLGKNKSNRNAMSSIMISLLLTFVIYICLGVLAIFIFGNELEKSVITNVNQEVDIFSYIIRVAFMIVLACHIPYLFFVLKESMLIVVDEARN